MSLLNKSQTEKLHENGREGNIGKDHFPVVKLFLPETACTWLLTELDQDTPTVAFGLCDLGMGFPELGYVSMDELKELRSPRLKLPIECDHSFKAGYPISVYAEAARICETITENEQKLKEAATRLAKRGYRYE